MPPIIPILPILLLLVALAAFVGRAWIPWSPLPAHGVLCRVPLSLLGRLRMQAVPGALLLALATAGWLAGWLPPWAAALAPVAVGLAVALPFRYTLTTEGLIAGRGRPRRWTEFGGVGRRRGGVRLQGIAGAPGQRVWLSGNRDDDEFVLLLRRLVRDAYKGEVGPAPPDRPAGTESVPILPLGRAPAVPSEGCGRRATKPSAVKNLAPPVPARSHSGRQPPR